jgi:hypothetical protein
MEIIEQEIKKFLDKWSLNEHMRGQLDIDLHFFMRAVMRSHDELMNPEAYTPARKNV